MKNELRRDYFLDKWVLYSPITGTKHGKCMLCEETKPIFFVNSRGKQREPWQVKVIEDPYPPTHPSKFKLEGLGTFFSKAPAHGYSEIVIETPKHKPFHELTTNQINLCFYVYKKRIEELKTRDKVESVVVEKAYFDHSFTRIFTLPKVPDKLKDELMEYNAYYKRKEECMFCNLIKQEKEERKVYESKEFVVLAPYASLSPYETWILPKKHIQRFTMLNDNQLYELAEILRNLTRKLAKLNLDYNFTFHESPVAQKMQDFHFHIELYPTWLQKSRNITINRIFPERAASDLRFK